MSRLSNLAITAVTGYAALSLARRFVRRRRNFAWADCRVVITGGSRGLGLAIARQLAARGARIAICARNAENLSAAASDLRSSGAEVFTKTCDVRNRDEVVALIHDVGETFGGIDVLINVAGIITVGPLEAMTLNDFHNSMDTNCWGALHTTLEVLPYMRRQHWGRIVNIASLGGKRAVPHLLPYVASKFALVGLSNGLRAELKHENIFVTTACPGLMRTGSPRNAIFKGQHRREYAWFSIGDSLPLLSMDADAAAIQIIEACQQGRGELTIANRLNITTYLQAMFPELTREILELSNRLLPKMGGIGRASARGYESESSWSPSVLTSLTQKAALENNQI